MQDRDFAQILQKMQKKMSGGVDGAPATISVLTSDTQGPVLDENVPSKNVNRMQVVQSSTSNNGGTTNETDPQNRAEISFSGNTS